MNTPLCCDHKHLLIFKATVTCPSHNIFFDCLFPGTIVSVGDPKRKYTKFEKIGQG